MGSSRALGRMYESSFMKLCVRLRRCVCAASPSSDYQRYGCRTTSRDGQRSQPAQLNEVVGWC